MSERDALVEAAQPPEGIPLSCRAWYEQGRNDFIAACENGQADGWLCQFAPAWHEDGVRAERDRVRVAIEALSVCGIWCGSDEEPIQWDGVSKADVLAVLRDAEARP